MPFCLLQPYKTAVYNVADTVWLTNVALIYFCIAGTTLAESNPFFITHARHPPLFNVIIFMLCVFTLVPFIYMTVLVLYWLFFRHTKMAALVLKIRLLCNSAVRQSNSEESLAQPDRLANPEECAALLQDPMDVDQYNSITGLLQ